MNQNVVVNCDGPVPSVHLVDSIDGNSNSPLKTFRSNECDKPADLGLMFDKVAERLGQMLCSSGTESDPSGGAHRQLISEASQSAPY